jgi:hypothetical protein
MGKRKIVDEDFRLDRGLFKQFAKDLARSIQMRFFN